MNYNVEYKAESKVIKGLILKAEGKTYTLERDGECITANAKGFNSLIKLFNQDLINELVTIGWLVKKECSVCGKVFYKTKPTAKGMFCSEDCKKSHVERYRHTKYKELLKEKENKAKAKETSKHLDSEIDKARELGLSYGQYKAKKYIEEMGKIEIE